MLSMISKRKDSLGTWQKHLVDTLSTMFSSLRLIKVGLVIMTFQLSNFILIQSNFILIQYMGFSLVKLSMYTKELGELLWFQTVWIMGMWNRWHSLFVLVCFNFLGSIIGHPFSGKSRRRLKFNSYVSYPPTDCLNLILFILSSQ